MKGEITYYKILGVNENASSHELRKAFCKLSIELHPDTTSLELGEAKNKFQEVLEAYENLNNSNLDLITKLNYLTEFLKIILKSHLITESLSGIYKIFNNAKFNNLKISNILNDINNLRDDYYKVPQINETHIMNYIFSELKNSIKI